MFILQKNNKSGTTIIQIIDKSRGRYKVVKTIGNSLDPLELDWLNVQAKSDLVRLTQQLDLNFKIGKEKELERQLKFTGARWSPEKAIEIANTIFEITIITPFSKNIEAILHLQNDEQIEILRLFKPSVVSLNKI